MTLTTGDTPQLASPACGDRRIMTLTTGNTPQPASVVLEVAGP